jgi:hypothetical protein
MGKLEDALENAGEGGGEGGGGGLGGMVGSGGVELQEGERGASPEDQIAGEGTLPDDEGGSSERAMPTSPEGADAIPE